MDESEETEETTYWWYDKPSKTVVAVSLVLMPFLLLGLSGKLFYERVDFGLNKWRFQRAHGRPMFPIEEIVVKYSKRL